MMTPRTCLSAETLQQLSRGELAPVTIREIESHVDECDHCRELLKHEPDSRWHDEIRQVLISEDSELCPPARTKVSGTKLKVWAKSWSFARFQQYFTKSLVIGRPKRSDEAGCIDQMLNRANRLDEIFAKQANDDANARPSKEVSKCRQGYLNCHSYLTP